jgi:hypothetical protein
MEALPLAFTTGWASGINAYAFAALITAAVLLVTGLASVNFAIRAIRRGLARFRAWRERRNAPAAWTSVA